jgi:hypothetical protein
VQTLGLSDSTPRTESRGRALFWPTIRNDGDFDYVTRQGFWVCFLIGGVTLVVSIFSGASAMAYFESIFFFLAAFGIRERSRAAAISAFSAYLLDLIVLEAYTGTGLGVLRVVSLALLFANIRGSWLSSRWTEAPETPLDSFRMNQTIIDKLVDQLPTFLWPKIKYVFYIYTAVMIALLLFLLLRAPVFAR